MKYCVMEKFLKKTFFEEYNKLKFNPDEISKLKPLYYTGDIVRFKSDTLKQDISENFFKSKKQTIVLIKSYAYVLAGKIYYDVYVSENNNITVLREDEIEKF